MRNAKFFAVAALLGLAGCGDGITAPDARPVEDGARLSVLPTGVSAKLAPGGPYNLRSGPGTGYAVEGSLAGGAAVTITCTSRGESVSGEYGTGRVWDRLANGSYVADVNVYTGTDGAAARPCQFDDYPYKTASTSGVDAWNFYNRQCTSFAAFRINWNGTRTGRTFTNMYLGEHFGDAHMWDEAARASGVAISSTPAVGRIAQWNRNAGGVGGFGHVAYVSRVYSDGSILIEEYNWRAYAYGTRRLYPGGGYWPSNFIDF
ncbi:MAG TPA: CHAP domain-containing protein [Longimicrobium sp.]